MIASENDQVEEDISEQLSCMEIGACGELRTLDNKTAVVDLTAQIDLATVVEDPKTGDLLLNNMRILSPGVRNNFIYSKDAVKTTRHLKGLRDLNAAPSPFLVPHSSNPAEQIGRIENLRWSDEQDTILGVGRVFNDPDIPLSKTAIALMKREMETGGFISVSTRLRVEPYFDNAEGKASVRNLRLIHVAWVDVGADPTAGISMKEAQNTEESDTTQTNEANDSEHEADETIVQNLEEETTKERSLTMSDEDGEAQNNEVDNTEPITEPVTPPQTEEPQPPKVDNTADQDEVLTIKRSELDTWLSDIKTQMHKEFEVEQARKVIMSDVLKIDEAIPVEFLQSLDDAQLTAFKGIVDNFVGYIKEREDVVTELRSKSPLVTLDNEKPSYAGTRSSADDLKKIEHFYPPTMQGPYVPKAQRGGQT